MRKKRGKKNQVAALLARIELLEKKIIELEAKPPIVVTVTNPQPIYIERDPPAPQPMPYQPFPGNPYIPYTPPTFIPTWTPNINPLPPSWTCETGSIKS